MTINLAAAPVDPNQLDLLEQVTDASTPLGSLHRQDFEDACRAVACPGGWVNPNDVSKRLHDRFGEINPQAYSAQWGPACGRNGFMDKTEHPIGIDPTRSKGNGNKATVWRRLRPTT